MTLDYTFSMIKPEAVKSNLTGKILEDIEVNGFKILKLRKIKITHEQAKEFYISLKDMPFYEELCNYISSGDVVAMVIQKENAVIDFRNLIGSTDPAQANIGTLRKKYGISKGSNAIHGSDSDQNAIRETKFFDL